MDFPFKVFYQLQISHSYQQRHLLPEKLFQHFKHDLAGCIHCRQSYKLIQLR